jgi:hypothetical protein
LPQAAIGRGRPGLLPKNIMKRLAGVPQRTAAAEFWTWIVTMRLGNMCCLKATFGVQSRPPPKEKFRGDLLWGKSCCTMNVQ